MLSRQKNYKSNSPKVNQFLKKIIESWKSRLLKLLYTVIVSLSVLPFLSKDVLEVKKRISNRLPALDDYYYQRIFDADANILTHGNFYVDSEEFHYRSTTPLSIGESIQKLIFKLLRSNILSTYFFLTLVYLIIWIVLLTKLVDSTGSYYQKSIVAVIFIILFMGNSRVLNNEYPFARIISPQFTMILWLIGMYIIKTIYLEKANPKKFNLYVFLYSIVLIIASFSYLYSFLSLIGSGMILALFLLFEKKYIFSIYLFTSILIFSLPFMIINWTKNKEDRFIDATERMGLVHTRFPGSIITILLCSAIIIFIVLQSYLNKKRSKIDETKKTMMIMSLGVLLASQSQLITKMEIQFYHFNIFAQICFMIVLIGSLNNLVSKKFISTSRTFRIIACTLAISIFAVFSIYRLVVPLAQDYKYGSSNYFNNDQLNSNDKLIIDEPIYQYTFPIYSKAKVLYQADITAYGFTNFELFDRAYVSGGCPSKFSVNLKSELLVYRFEGIKQKYNSIIRYLDLLGLENYFSNYREKLLISLDKKQNEIENEFTTYILSQSGKDCLQKAKDFGINLIIFDKDSNWNAILNREKIKIEDYGFYGLMNARI